MSGPLVLVLRQCDWQRDRSCSLLRDGLWSICIWQFGEQRACLTDRLPLVTQSGEKGVDVVDDEGEDRHARDGIRRFLWETFQMGDATIEQVSCSSS